MSVERKVLARRGQHLVALPAAIRKHLHTAPGIVVYWRLGRRGEVTLARKDAPARGYKSARAECPSCAGYVRALQLAQARGLRRDLTLYGEGYAAGSIATHERLMHPTGRAANAARARHTAWVALDDAERRRQDRRVKRRNRRALAVEVAPGPDDYPSPSAPPSSLRSGGDAASGGEAPQAAHE